MEQIKDFIKNHWKFLLFFCFVVAVEIISVENGSKYHYLAKPMIVGSLLALYISNVEKQSYLVLTALIFAMLGDIFLMIPAVGMFVIGLVCFLIMQLLYISRFRKDYAKPSSIQYVLFAFFFLIALAAYYYLSDSLDSMKIPVILYITAIFAMVSVAIFRNSSIEGYSWITIGAFVFLISDLILAINKFKMPIDHSDFYIIITYAIAQLLIISGLVIQYESSKKILKK
jgi:uncharacterized membrane protein YhhN